MICKGKEKYLITMYGRAGPVPLPLPPPPLCRVSGGEGEAGGQILPGDSEWGRGLSGKSIPRVAIALISCE
jgi:hypothetical protein